MYKGKYFIFVNRKITETNNSDETVGIFETPQELANYLKKSLHKIYDLLGKHFNGTFSNDFWCDGKLCEISFVDMSEEI